MAINNLERLAELLRQHREELLARWRDEGEAQRRAASAAEREVREAERAADEAAAAIDRLKAQREAVGQRLADLAPVSEASAEALKSSEAVLNGLPDPAALEADVEEARGRAAAAANAVADKRAEATTRLDDLMKTSAMLTPRRMSRRRVAAVIFGCLLVGAALAAISRPRSLLAGAETGPALRGDVWSQLYQAKIVDTESAWRKAKDFPDATAYHQNLARQGLVYHYFSRARYADAIGPLEELAALGNTEPVFQAFGIAGLVVANAHLGDDEQAYNEYQRLDSVKRALLQEQAPRMAELLNEAIDELANRTS